MDEIVKIVAAGASFGGAMVDRLRARGFTSKSFADRHGLSRPYFAQVLSMRRIPGEAELDALATEFGGTREQWLAFWFRLARKTAFESASAPADVAGTAA